MKLLIQRVSSAKVDVDGKTIGKIGQGILVMVGFTKGDDRQVIKHLANKALNLRIFSDHRGRLHHSVLDLSGGILAVPQFTLYADASRGRRPDFTKALQPNLARQFFDEFVQMLTKYSGLPIAQGKFGANMQVKLVNDGPVTIMLTKENT